MAFKIYMDFMAFTIGMDMTFKIDIDSKKILTIWHLQ